MTSMCCLDLVRFAAERLARAPECGGSAAAAGDRGRASRPACRPGRGAGAAAAGTPAGRARRRRSDRTPGRARAPARRATTSQAPERRDLVDRRHQVAVVVDVADDGGADVARQRRPLACRLSCHIRWSASEPLRRERVLDRRQFLDFLRLPRPVARRRGTRRRNTRSPGRPRCRPSLGLLLGLGLARWRRGSCARVLARDLLEHRILHHLLIQQLGQLERRHRQQLDGLLQ